MSGINWSMYVNNMSGDLKVFKKTQDTTSCIDCKIIFNIEKIPYSQQKFAKNGTWICSKCHFKNKNREVIPKEVIPKEVIPKEVIPKEVIPKEVIPKEVIPKEVIPKEVIPKKTVSEIKFEKLNNTINDFIEDFFRNSNISNNNEYLDLWYNKNNQNKLDDFIKNRKIKMKETTEEKKLRVLEEREKKQSKTKIKKLSKENKKQKNEKTKK
jgi:hypothetical protein